MKPKKAKWSTNLGHFAKLSEALTLRIRCGSLDRFGVRAFFCRRKKMMNKLEKHIFVMFFFFFRDFFLKFPKRRQRLHQAWFFVFYEIVSSISDWKDSSQIFWRHFTVTGRDQSPRGRPALSIDRSSTGGTAVKFPLDFGGYFCVLEETGRNQESNMGMQE